MSDALGATAPKQECHRTISGRQISREASAACKGEGSEERGPVLFPVQSRELCLLYSARPHFCSPLAAARGSYHVQRMLRDLDGIVMEECRPLAAVRGRCRLHRINRDLDGVAMQCCSPLPIAHVCDHLQRIIRDLDGVTMHYYNLLTVVRRRCCLQRIFHQRRVNSRAHLHAREAL